MNLPASTALDTPFDFPRSTLAQETVKLSRQSDPTRVREVESPTNIKTAMTDFSLAGHKITETWDDAYFVEACDTPTEPGSVLQLVLVSPGVSSQVTEQEICFSNSLVWVISQRNDTELESLGALRTQAFEADVVVTRMQSYEGGIDRTFSGNNLSRLNDDKHLREGERCHRLQLFSPGSIRFMETGRGIAAASDAITEVPILRCSVCEAYGTRKFISNPTGPVLATQSVPGSEWELTYVAHN